MNENYGIRRGFYARFQKAKVVSTEASLDKAVTPERRTLRREPAGALPGLGFPPTMAALWFGGSASGASPTRSPDALLPSVFSLTGAGDAPVWQVSCEVWPARHKPRAHWSTLDRSTESRYSHRTVLPRAYQTIPVVCSLLIPRKRSLQGVKFSYRGCRAR